MHFYSCQGFYLHFEWHSVNLLQLNWKLGIWFPGQSGGHWVSFNMKSVPFVGLIEFNSDACALHNQDQLAVRGVIRDHNSVVLRVFSKTMWEGRVGYWDGN